jgi:archaellum biogenesis ATPase FlaH
MNGTNQGLLNETIVRRAIHTIKPEGGLFEIRIIGELAKSKISSGYFMDADTLISAFDKMDLRRCNVYITLNTINDACYSRKQRDHFEITSVTTDDKDIETLDWLFIDLDPERTKEVSSTKEELDEAIRLAGRVKKYLEGIGFERPVEALSGNGAHLLYYIGLDNTEENVQLVQACLAALDMMFSTDKVKIDTVNFNPSRICKLYGTAAQKGANSPERPHRISEIISDDFEPKQTLKCYLEELAGSVEEVKPAAAKYNNYDPNSFDLVSWMQRHGMGYREKSFSDGGRKYVLDECPFNGNHKAPDSMLILQPDGRIGFKCLHNSCRDKTWRDVWMMLDPTLYESVTAEEDRRIEEGWRKHNANRKDIPYKEDVLGESSEPVFFTADMIAEKPQEVREFIRTGTNRIDKYTMGLEKSAVSLVSGLRGGGKSTLLTGWMLNAIQDGHTVICYSGELTDRNFMRWMILQAAGKANTIPSNIYENYYTTSRETQLTISHWLGEKFWLYNNNYGNNYQQVYDLIRKQTEEKKADFIVIDNIMALDLSAADRDKYDAQTRFIWMLKDLAKIANAHVLFVAHPRKAAGFLRLDDVSGSGNIGNIVDNAFIVHRNNDDFKNQTKAMFKRKDDWEGYSGTNVIEICKNRDLGVQDMFIPLWYEPQTKRLKSFQSENIVYGWDKFGGFTVVHDEEVPW